MREVLLILCFMMSLKKKTNPSRRFLSTSTDKTSSILIDNTSDPTIDCFFIVSNDCSTHRPMRPCRYHSTSLQQQQSIVTSLCRSTLTSTTRLSFLLVKLCIYVYVITITPTEFTLGTVQTVQFKSVGKFTDFSLFHESY